MMTYSKGIAEVNFMWGEFDFVFYEQIRASAKQLKLTQPSLFNTPFLFLSSTNAIQISSSHQVFPDDSRDEARVKMSQTFD